jgi:hypothetical protein
MRAMILVPLFILYAACPKSSEAQAAQTAKPAPATTAAPSTPAPVPYSVALQGFSIAGFPGVHSAVVAGAPEQLVVLGGRRNGLHGFPSGKTAAAGPSFPKTEANNTVYVLDLVHQKLLGSASVTSLPTAIASQMQATDMQYQLLNGWLYLLGGYGPGPGPTGTLTTLGTATVINFEALVNAAINNQKLDATFAAANIVQFQHPALAITGGGLALLPDASGGPDFVLAFGQQYAGEYTAGGGLVSQTYADGVRIFQFTYPAGSTKPSAINFIAAMPDPGQVQQSPENPFHRRDYTLKASLDSSGNRRLVAYGGVFKGGRFEGFLNPVFIGPGSGTVKLTPSSDFQLMSQYETAAIQLYDKNSSTMYTTFFGGISQYYWDAATKTLKHDALDLKSGVDGLPFINSVSTLRMSTITDTGSQYLHVGESFPPASAIPSCSGTPAPYGGAQAAFVIATRVPQATDGVVQLNGITKPTVIGYVVGGIAATAPYPSSQGTSCASGTLYQVTLNPTRPTNTVLLAPIKP